ncbi:MAG: hypothetical protein BWY11_01339 [Firmicutes bacterium ADurb.Bin182]|nr:MAG: hypothetical protein BWY11_01339 [Firmicutes bacterium ADurb.Bin182]
MLKAFRNALFLIVAAVMLFLSGCQSGSKLISGKWLSISPYMSVIEFDGEDRISYYIQSYDYSINSRGSGKYELKGSAVDIKTGSGNWTFNIDKIDADRMTLDLNFGADPSHYIKCKVKNEDLIGKWKWQTDGTRFFHNGLAGKHVEVSIEFHEDCTFTYSADNSYRGEGTFTFSDEDNVIIVHSPTKDNTRYGTVSGFFSIVEIDGSKMTIQNTDDTRDELIRE